MKRIISYQIQEYGTVRVKLAELLADRKITRNHLRTLTGIKYDVIDRYYKAQQVEKADLDVLARICCALECRIEDLLEYVPYPEREKE